MRWGTAANAAFGMPEGFFIGPYGRDGSAVMGTYKRPTSALLADVAKRGWPRRSATSSAGRRPGTWPSGMPPAWP